MLFTIAPRARTRGRDLALERGRSRTVMWRWRRRFHEASVPSERDGPDEAPTVRIRLSAIFEHDVRLTRILVGGLAVRSALAPSAAGSIVSTTSDRSAIGPLDAQRSIVVPPLVFL